MPGMKPSESDPGDTAEMHLTGLLRRFIRRTFSVSFAQLPAFLDPGWIVRGFGPETVVLAFSGLQGAERTVGSGPCAALNAACGGLEPQCIITALYGFPMPYVRALAAAVVDDQGSARLRILISVERSPVL